MTDTRNFYDVVVLGAGLGALAAGALAARRGFRVCLVPDGDTAPCYEHEGLRLWREPSAHPSVHTPVFARLAEELALGPLLRRLARPCAPALQVVLPEHRLELGTDPERLRAELERELPEVRQGAEEMHARLRELQARLSRWLGSPVQWPPDGFFERRAARKAQALAGEEGEPGALLSGFAQGNPLRAAVEATARLWARTDPERAPAVHLARSYALHLEGAHTFLDGAHTLHGLLQERLLQLGGEVRPRDRLARVDVRRGRVRGVCLETTDELLGCRWVLTSRSGAAALRACEAEPERGLSERLLACEPVASRVTVNLVLRARGIPLGLGERVVLCAPGAELGPLWLERHAQADGERVVLSCTALAGRGQLVGLRERVREAVGWLLPWLDAHLLMVDCPQDGRPLQDLAEGREVMPAERWRGEAEPAPAVYGADPEGYAGLGALPFSLGVEGLLRVGAEVLPALGEEGELLAAWSAAGRVAASDPGRERLRREVWGGRGG